MDNHDLCALYVFFSDHSRIIPYKLFLSLTYFWICKFVNKIFDESIYKRCLNLVINKRPQEKSVLSQLQKHGEKNLMFPNLNLHFGSAYLNLKKRVFLCAASFSGGYYFVYLLSSSPAKCEENKNIQNVALLNDNFASYVFVGENPELNFTSNSTQNAWRSQKKISTPMYWRLLELSKSKHRTVRHAAVKSLAENIKLEKWEYQMIAQACGPSTAVGLARMMNTSPLFFLRPPFRDLEEGDLNEELLLLLSSVPYSNEQPCIQLQIKQAKSLATIILKHQITWHTELEDQTGIYHSLQRKKILVSFHKGCLEVILECSAIKSVRDSMINQGVLKILLKILKCHENDTMFESLIAQILANLALDEKSSNIIIASGWLGILSMWARSSSIKVNLPALKALANLDRDDVFYSEYDNGVYILHPTFRQSSKNIYADIIFVHGLLGATFWTWRQSDDARLDLSLHNKKQKNSDEPPLNATKNLDSYTMCWPKDWLAVDFKELRLIAVDYQTCISYWSCKCPQEKEKDSLDAKAKEIIKKLILAHVGDRPIIWVAHSMGGLLVKQILVEAASSKEEKVNLLAKNSVGLVFYSVPHRGSEVANMLYSASRIFQPSIDMIQLQKETPNLLHLHEKFKDFIFENNVAMLSFGETKPSPWRLNLTPLVPLDSSNPGFGEFVPLSVDHLSTCKPMSQESVIYTKLSEFLLAHIPVLSSHVFQPRRLPKTLVEISNLLSLIP